MYIWRSCCVSGCYGTLEWWTWMILACRCTLESLRGSTCKQSICLCGGFSCHDHEFRIEVADRSPVAGPGNINLTGTNQLTQTQADLWQGGTFMNRKVVRCSCCANVVNVGQSPIIYMQVYDQLDIQKHPLPLYSDRDGSDIFGLRCDQNGKVVPRCTREFSSLELLGIPKRVAKQLLVFHRRFPLVTGELPAIISPAARSLKKM